VDTVTARVPLPAILKSSGVVAVLRADHAGGYRPVIEALRAGGITSIELTLTTPGTFDVLAELAAEFADVEFGVGTVTDLESCRLATEAGAAYVVTPVTDHDLATMCARSGLPCLMGAFTPTEAYRAWTSGVSAVKLFPASTAGAGHLAQLRGPFPDMAVVPSGGVELKAVRDWLRAGAVAVSVGGPLVQDAFRGGDLGALTERARTLRRSVDDARADMMIAESIN
jgi:2-dehydro-3-deoxyphosphogluconate aldolase/(4S)-4-hydroxy-2-oxoglutarate aldolase